MAVTDLCDLGEDRHVEVLASFLARDGQHKRLRRRPALFTPYGELVSHEACEEMAGWQANNTGKVVTEVPVAFSPKPKGFDR